MDVFLPKSIAGLLKRWRFLVAYGAEANTDEHDLALSQNIWSTRLPMLGSGFSNWD